MQLSHVISDLVLALVALGVWMSVALRLPRLRIWPWGFFLVPVALAALFGAARFAGLHPSMQSFSSFFQQFASTAGAIGLALGVLLQLSESKTATQRPFISFVVVICLALGIVLFLLANQNQWKAVFELLPLAAMICVLGMGFWQMAVGPNKSRKLRGLSIVSAVLLSAAAMFSLQKLPSPVSIDAYHYLLAASLVAFGLSVDNSQKPEEAVSS
jgi:hypothetical protein